MKRKRIFRGLMYSAPLIALLGNVGVVMAEDNAGATLRKTLAKYFIQNDWLAYIGRSLGGLIIHFLLKLEITLSKFLDVIYGLIGFSKDSQINHLIHVLQPIVYSAFVLALLFYCYQKIINPEFGGQIVTNLLIGILAVTSLATVMNVANDIVLKSKDVIMGQEAGTLGQKTTAQLIDDVYVLEYYNFNLDKYNEDKDKIKPIHHADVIEYFDLSEMIDPDAGHDTTSTNPWTNEIPDHDTFDFYELYDGVYRSQPIEIEDPSFLDFGMFLKQYYRYKVEWLPIFISLISFIVVYILSSYKVMRIIFEIALQKIITPWVALTDLANGKKIRQLLTGLFSAYATLIFIALLQRVFGFATTYIVKNIDNPLYSSLAIMFLAIAVVDGPNFWEQLFGIDAGLKSGFAMFAIARTVAGGVRGINNFAHNVRRGHGGNGGGNHNSNSENNSSHNDNPLNETNHHNNSNGAIGGATGMSTNNNHSSSMGSTNHQANINNDSATHQSIGESASTTEQTPSPQPTSSGNPTSTGDIGGERSLGESLEHTFIGDNHQDVLTQPKDGKNGLNGLNGRDGLNGRKGIAGEHGKMGEKGIDGQTTLTEKPIDTRSNLD